MSFGFYFSISSFCYLPAPLPPPSLSILLILSHSALMTHLRWQPLCLLVLLASANISMCEKHKHHERVSLPSLMSVCVCVCVSGYVCVCVFVLLLSPRLDVRAGLDFFLCLFHSLCVCGECASVGDCLADFYWRLSMCLCVCVWVLVSVCATPSGVFKALNNKAKEKRRKTPLALAKGEREEAQMLWLPTFL